MLARSQIGLCMTVCAALCACGTSTSDKTSSTGGSAGKSGKTVATKAKDGGAQSDAARGGGGSGDAAASGGKRDASSPGAFFVQSDAFKDGSKIDAKYRCMGPSPDLKWGGAPDKTMSYAVVLKDVTPGFSQNFLHWVIYDIPSSVSSLSENLAIGYEVADLKGAHQAPIWNGTLGFNGPCAPSGTNTYELTLYALDVTTLPNLSMSSKGADVVSAIEAHALAMLKSTVMSSP
jgi:Raf kinase inhibitor-like YbhB/YbcL family protein